jgi:branched-chain amino acid transport system substrate-binding protein
MVEVTCVGCGVSLLFGMLTNRCNEGANVRVQRFRPVIRLVAVFPVALGMLMAISTVSASAALKAPYVVGVVSSDTAGGEPASTDVPITVAAWQSWTNQHGGINGHSVKVIELNDAANPATSTSDVEKLISTDHVLGIVDDTAEDSAWQSTVAAANVPVFCGTSTGNGFTCSNSSDFFPGGNSVIAGVWGQAKAAKLGGSKNLFIMYDSGEAAASEAVPLQKGFTTGLGLKFSGAVGISPTASDYTAACLAAQSAGAQAIFPEANATQVAKSCVRQGYKPLYILAQGAFGGPYLKDPDLNKAIGPMGVFPFFVDNSPATHAFHEALKKYWPDFNSFASPYDASATWVALQMFAAASAHLPATPTPADVTAGVYALPKGFTLGGLIPPETLTSGQVHTNSCFYIVQLKNKKYTTPFGDKTFCQPAAAPAS